MLKESSAQFGPWLAWNARAGSAKTAVSGMSPELPVFREMTRHIISLLSRHGILTPTAIADVKFGTTMVLYRSEANRLIESQRISIMKAASVKINKTCRSFLIRMFVKSTFYRLRVRIMTCGGQRMCMRAKAWLAARVLLRLARLPPLQAGCSAHVAFAPRVWLRQSFSRMLRPQKTLFFQ